MIDKGNRLEIGRFLKGFVSGDGEDRVKDNGGFLPN